MDANSTELPGLNWSPLSAAPLARYLNTQTQTSFSYRNLTTLLRLNMSLQAQSVVCYSPVLSFPYLPLSCLSKEQQSPMSKEIVHSNTHRNTHLEYTICKELLGLCLVRNSEFKISGHHYLFSGHFSSSYQDLLIGQVTLQGPAYITLPYKKMLFLISLLK